MNLLDPQVEQNKSAKSAGPTLKPQPSKRRIAALTALWSTFVTLVAFAGPRWITLACEIATDRGVHLYRVDQMQNLAPFLAVLMVLVWLAALVLPLIWLTRRFRTWRKWMAFIPVPAVVLSFLVSLFSFGLKEFVAYLAAL